jgi:hypothetical protein
MLAVLADGLAALLADLAHVLAIFTDGLAAFSRNLSLLVIVHRRKTALAVSAALAALILCHC